MRRSPRASGSTIREVEQRCHGAKQRVNLDDRFWEYWAGVQGGGLIELPGDRHLPLDVEALLCFLSGVPGDHRCGG